MEKKKIYGIKKKLKKYLLWIRKIVVERHPFPKEFPEQYRSRLFNFLSFICFQSLRQK